MHDAAVRMVQKFLPKFPKYTRVTVQTKMVSHAGADQIKCDDLAPTIEHPEARYIETNSGGATWKNCVPLSLFALGILLV